MYCPKCKQNFEEGSRRFCPTDGSRLVSEALEEVSAGQNDIFSHLIARTEAIKARDEKLAEKPTPQPSSGPQIPGGMPARGQENAAFFELNDPALDLGLDDEPISSAPAPQVTASRGENIRPQVRKVNPNEIPAGHVELRPEGRVETTDIGFIAGNPEAFIGRTVKGRYKVTEFLGGDSTGLAYLAEDKLAEDKKVLVRILLNRGADELMTSALAEERVALSHLAHPNIARLIDSGQFTGGDEFLVTEYIDALSVRDALSIKERLEANRVAKLVRQIANALGEAHQQGVIHRDVRPENIILDALEDGTELPKIVNFGASDGEANPHNMQYRAPEVLDGRIPTAASDIYSLAVVAYEMLTGQPPFQGDSSKDILRAIQGGPDRPLSALGLNLPPAVDDVFVRVFSPSPASRYSKAREFGDALAAAVSTPGKRRVPHRTKSEHIEIESPPIGLKKAAKIRETVKLEPVGMDAEPAWTQRSPAPEQASSTKLKVILAVGLPLLLIIITVGWLWLVYLPNNQGTTTPGVTNVPANSAPANATASTNVEVPPLARTISPPPNTNYYQTAKPNLKGDLLLHYVGFSLFYPKDWKMIGPQPGQNALTRGKFLDISRQTSDGRMKEQMLVSYYPSKGTFQEDADRFPLLVNEANETLKKFLPEYQMVSEGEVKINGGWQAYEVKFQGGGTSASGEKLVVWGRRLFIPAGRPGVRDGFEITMLATSLAENVHSVDDVGARGELAAILYSFEPSQNF